MNNSLNLIDVYIGFIVWLDYLEYRKKFIVVFIKIIDFYKKEIVN